MFPLLTAILVAMATRVIAAESLHHISLRMPGVSPPKPETYYCTSMRLDSNQDYYVVAFEPNATMLTAHHLLLYGCDAPGTNEQVWTCGDMSVSDPKTQSGPVCGAKTTVVYAWARDAPRLQLPEGVAFHLGRNTQWRYLTLQVHYADVTAFSDGVTTDDTGVSLSYTTQKLPRSAGVFVLGTGGYIEPKQREHMEVDCQLEENIVLHPFAFRVHTHSLGEVVSGYRVRMTGQWRGIPLGYEWTLLGKMNPQLPQMFYEIQNPVPLQQEDILAARCTMYNYRDSVTTVGLTSENEMCNLYLMYWTEANETLQSSSCGSLGPPYYYWNRNSRPRLRDIPDQDASHLSVEELRQYLQLTT